jgi:small-conductance mechanosensitive channel
VRFVIICIALIYANPALSQTVEEQPTGMIAVTDSAQQDAAIAVRMRDILSELDGFDDVTVSVSSGIITFRGTTIDATDTARLNDLAGRVEGVVAIENLVVETSDISRRLDPALERFKDRFAQLVAFAPLLLVAVIVFGCIVVVGFLVARLRQPWDRIAPNAFIADIYRQLLRLGFTITGLVVALDILNATALLSTILGAAGIIGLAIGFAVRDTVENFIASIMLSIRQPFRPNDTIEIGGDIGKVIRLTSRATILLSFDGNHIRIPNATVFKSRIVNFSRNQERRVLFDLGVAADTDLKRASDIVADTLNGLSFTLAEPAVTVWVEDFGDSSITIRATCWIDQHQTSYVMARGEAMRLCKAALEEVGITLPEPTYRLITAAEQTRASPTPQTKTTEPEQKTDAAADTALERIVEAERQMLETDDLLNREAPEE